MIVLIVLLLAYIVLHLLLLLLLLLHDHLLVLHADGLLLLGCIRHSSSNKLIGLGLRVHLHSTALHERGSLHARRVHSASLLVLLHHHLHVALWLLSLLHWEIATCWPDKRRNIYFLLFYLNLRKKQDEDEKKNLD